MTVFQVYSCPLEKVASFKYLVRLLKETNYISHSQNTEDTEELGQTVADLGAGGRRFSDVGSPLPHNSAGHPALCCRDLCRDTIHQADDGLIPPQV